MAEIVNAFDVQYCALCEYRVHSSRHANNHFGICAKSRKEIEKKLIKGKEYKCLYDT